MAAKQRKPAPELVDYEVLTAASNGHRTVHRVQASSKAAAEKAVTLDAGSQVVAADVAGRGIGSGDTA
jgi:hypothetical protein